MRLITKDIIGIVKFCLGALSVFLILFGIHWMLILGGVILGVLYYAIPAKYVY
jgi:hypothetical protein